MSFSISAIVCTYNRKDLLLEAIRTLIEQDLPPEQYEIVVVDNNSTDGTRDAVDGTFGKVRNLRVIAEPTQGLARARNTGVKACQSPIAAFTDDDALVPRDWLRRIVRRYEALDPMTACVGGEVQPLFEGERPAWLSDALLRPLSAGLMWDRAPRYLKDDEWLVEVNSAYRIEPLLRHGGFPEKLGRIGDSLLSCENFVNHVLRHAGHHFFYDPEIVVQHRVPSSRMTRGWFRRRMFWQGVSLCAGRDYLNQRGINTAVRRPLDVPCTPADWVKLFDEEVGDDEFARSLNAAQDMGYLLASQNLISGR